MLNTSIEYKQAIEKSGRRFVAKIVCDGKEYTSIKDFKYKGGTNSTDVITFGDAVSSYFECTLLNVPSNTYLKGKKANVYIGLQVMGSIEWISLGVFNLEKPIRSNADVKIVAYDNFSLCYKGFFSDLKGNQKIVTIIEEQCNKIGIKYNDGADDTTYNVDMLQGLTIIEVFSQLASYCGKNAIMDRNGKLKFVWYANTMINILPSRYANPIDMQEEDTFINRLICVVDEKTTLSVGTGIGISFSCQGMTQARLNALYERIKGFTYRALKLDWKIAQPDVEAGDIVKVVTNDGTVHKVPLMCIEFSFDGGFYGTIESKGKTQEEQEHEYKGPLQQKIERTFSDIISTKQLLADTITAYEGNFETIETNYLKVNKEIQAFSGKFVTIDGDIATFKSTITNELAATNGKIHTLETVELTSVKASISEANITIGKINTLLSGSITAGSGQLIVLNAKNTTIENALIKSAMIDTLDFNKLTGIDINTTNFKVHSKDGLSQWADNTIIIKDASRTRVQIGKDASNDYNMYVWDATGKLMFDATGVTANGIQKPIIRDDMISSSANISGDKINISSVINKINTNGTLIESSHVKYDGKSLDVSFASLKTEVTENSSLLASQTTQLTAVQGKISTLITDVTQTKSDLTDANGSITTLRNNYSSLSQTVGGLSTLVGSHTSSIASVNKAINDLEIGGRNLLYNSAVTEENLTLWNKALVTATVVKENNFDCFKVVPTGTIADQGLNGGANIISDSKLYPDRTYCYSIWCKTTTNQPVALFSIMHFQTTNSNGPHHKKNEKYNVSSIVANTWTRLYVTFEVTEQCYFKPYLWYLKTGTTYFFYDFKVEEGTRPTDWTPAPEDIDKSIDDLDKTITATKSQVSSLVLDYNGFKTSVSDTYTTKTEFNGLSVGGRNLALGTSNKYSTPRAEFTGGINICMLISPKVLIDGLKVGDTITVRLLYKYTNIVPTVGKTATCLIQGSGNVTAWSLGSFGGCPTKTITGSGEHEFLYTLKITAEHLKNEFWQNVAVRHDYVQSGSVCWKMFKVENGTKNGDWTPAPEDIDADIKLVDGKFVNYSTTTQMNSAITQTSKDITQAVSNTYATLSNLGGLSTRVASAESKLTSSALITTISSGLSGGSALTTTKYTMDLTGLHIKGGGIDISNNAGTKVLYADVNGNLVMNNLTAKYGSFEGTITSTGPQGHWARVDGGIVSVGKNNIEYGKMVASWEAGNPNIHYVALVADESSEELHIGADTGNNSNYPYYKMKAKKTLSVGEYRHDFVESVFAWTLRTTALYLGERSGNYYGTIGRNGTTIVCYNKAGTEFMFSSDTAWATMTHGPIEMYAPQPYIDFHFANSGADYSTRIICHGYGQMGYYGSWNALSDRRKKRNIMSLDDRYIDLLMRLDPCKFIYQYNSQIFDKYTLGYIAQDVTQAIKDVGLEKDNLNIVTYDETNDTYSMSYNDIEPIHTLAIQKLMKGFYELKNENANLKQRLEQLEKTRRA